MLKLVILVSGGGTNLQAILDALDAGKITDAEIVTVISNNPHAYALERARKHQVPTQVIAPKDFENRQAFNETMLQALDNSGADLVVMAGSLLMLAPEITAAYANRIINIHPALIPAFSGTGYYGIKVHEAALKRGVKLTGATVHFVNEETDGGPIILQKAVSVREDDTPESLQRRVMEEAEWQILPEAINLIAHGKVELINGQVRIKE